MKHTAAMAAAALCLVGCAGQVKYVSPSASTAIVATKTVAKSRDDLWMSLVPALGKQFFVINNLDKSSGLVNVSYSGDPEKYVDCGRINSFVKNARGERTYDFPASRGQMEYEIFTPQMQLIFLSRRMELDGRINLVLEAVGPTQTLVTANTRYVLKRDQSMRDVEGRTSSTSHSTSFNGGQMGRFPSANGQGGLECQATGALERELLDLVR